MALALLLLSATIVGWVLAIVYLPPETGKGAQLFVHLCLLAISLLALVIVLRLAVDGSCRRRASLEEGIGVPDPSLPPGYQRRGSLVGLLSGVHTLPTIPEMKESHRDCA
ncbi:hypothetical protein EXIGLDRAFT_735195 [Exidia glandulosa HHB12029]|uniref:Uncharacterized protein n=1 Tax=Exidia glandulosa HHB12029 TaxID=1314781 RepID=A0A165JXA2_EXIGL|nr:hypothetical protein EXIGLDRAFT_735195 [Exidia glandulosa HHB12029]